MKLDPQARYTDKDEWVRLEGSEAVSGLTDYAQSQLSDLVYVELPNVGAKLKKGESYATVESVKAASDVYMPLGGEITAVNQPVADTPELINQDAFGNWLIRFKPDNPAEFDSLMTAEQYRQYRSEG